MKSSRTLVSSRASSSTIVMYKFNVSRTNDKDDHVPIIDVAQRASSYKGNE